MARRWLIAGTLVLAGVGLTACTDTPANDFEAGECTDDSLTGTIGEIDTVDCDEQHTAEAIAQFDLDGDDYPGDTEIRQEGQSECEGDRFEDYVGVPYNESVFLVQPITPSEDSWDGGDRTVICVIVGRVDNAPLEGSAEGANE